LASSFTGAERLKIGARFPARSNVASQIEVKTLQVAQWLLSLYRPKTNWCYSAMLCRL